MGLGGNPAAGGSLGIGGAVAAGGSPGAGGVASAGGSINVGGVVGNGGSVGQAGAGGAAALGGAPGAGGILAAGGSVGTGGTQGGPACQQGARDYRNGNGSVTYYSWPMGATLNCSYEVVADNTIRHVATGSGQYLASLSGPDYDNAAACGACVEVTRDDGRSVVATVVDQCGTGSQCRAGHIVLSEPAFLQISTKREGDLGTGNGGLVGVISWRYVPCPTNEPITLRLKKDGPDAEWWNQILIEGHRYPIAKVEVMINGRWVDSTREPYNYWTPTNPAMGSPPYTVRITDIHGSEVQATLQLVKTDQVGTAQFPVCQ